MKMMTQKTKMWLGAAALVLSSSLLTGAIMTNKISMATTAVAADAPATAAPAAAVPGGLVDLTTAAERSVNSVVYIKVTQNAKRQTVTVRDPFEEFFGDFFGYGNRGRGRQQEIETQPKRQGAGSGVIVEAYSIS